MLEIVYGTGRHGRPAECGKTGRAAWTSTAQPSSLTGGTGSFGNAFVERALRDLPDAIIRVFSRDELKQSEMQARFGDAQNLRYFVGDVRNRSRLTRACRAPTSSSTPRR